MDKEGSSMTKLDDLPSLGGFGGKADKKGAGFGAKQEDDDGFDDFDMDEDKFGDSSNKFDDAERFLQD